MSLSGKEWHCGMNEEITLFKKGVLKVKKGKGCRMIFTKYHYERNSIKQDRERVIKCIRSIEEENLLLLTYILSLTDNNPHYGCSTVMLTATLAVSIYADIARCYDTYKIFINIFQRVILAISAPIKYIKYTL